jgi:hypothetical protein
MTPTHQFRYVLFIFSRRIERMRSATTDVRTDRIVLRRVEDNRWAAVKEPTSEESKTWVARRAQSVAAGEASKGVSG